MGYRKLCLLSPVFIVLTALVLGVNAQPQNNNAVEVAFPNLTFNQPVGIFNDNVTDRLFVTEQAGVIRVFNNTQNATSSTVFLDLTSRVLYGGEQGLLGLAFHPSFGQNGFLYVNYVADNPRRTVIARYTAMPNDNFVDGDSELVILEVNQPPFNNHKGGQLAFGADGYLYIGLGDGGSAGDPFRNAQNLSSLLGKILRLDVDASSSNRHYGIPSDNPFAGNGLGYREEIYAYGFRNPWRFSFDFKSGRLWVADVGQNRLEEIDLVERSKNYGWNIVEGTLCYDPPSGCNQTGLELPIWTYTRDLGTAVIGGFVYHGSALPSLIDTYVYGDYGSGRIWALRINGENVTNLLLADTELNIASFGLDKDGELYLCAYNGKIYMLNPEVIPELTLHAICVVILTVLVVTVLFRFSKKKGGLMLATSEF